MVKVSIIVPVYNVEAYLPKCLDSLINQTLKDIEIIVVNDGTKDNSQEIIDEYKKKDKRIVSIIKENGGQGSARNLGLKKARGEFISFVDSDDWIELDMIERLYGEAKSTKSDIVVSDYSRVTDNNKTLVKSFNTVGENNIKSYILNVAGPCCKIIKKSILLENELYFPEGIIYEDYAIVPTYALFAKKISYIEEAFYNYLIRENSTMTQKFNKKFYDIITATDLLYKRLKENDFKYYDEYEYLIIKNIFREAYVRLIPFEEGTKVLNDISAWAKANIPHWTKNKYYKKEGFKARVFSYLIYKRQYKLLQLIHKLKGAKKYEG